MQIALVGPYPALPGQPFGGVEAAVELLAQGLHEAGEDVVVVDLFTGYSPSISSPAGPLVLRMGPLTTRNQFSRRLRQELRTTLKTLNSDITHFHLSPQFSDLARHSIMTIHGLPHLETKLRHPGFSGAFRAQVVRKCHEMAVRKVDHVLALSSEIETYAHALGVPTTPTFNPVAPSYFRANKAENRHFLAVGTVMPGKNQLELIRAFGRYVEDGGQLSLVIAGKVGDADYFETCGRAAGEYSSRIEFLGQVARDDIISLHNHAAGLLHFSKRETASLTTSESLAAGTPVLSTAVGNAHQQIQAGVNGFMIDPDFLLDDAARRIADLERLSSRPHTNTACRHSAQNHDYREVARKTLEVYDRACKATT